MGSGGVFRVFGVAEFISTKLKSLKNLFLKILFKNTGGAIYWILKLVQNHAFFKMTLA